MIRALKSVTPIVLMVFFSTAQLDAALMATTSNGSVSVLFVVNTGVCQNACTVAMRNLYTIVQSVRGSTDIPVEVHVEGSRKRTAEVLAEQIGFPLLETLPADVSEIISGMRRPVAIIRGPSMRMLVIDNVTQRSLDFMTETIRGSSAITSRTDSSEYLRTTPLTCLDSIELSGFQALSDSTVLVYDKIQMQAAVVDVRQDRIIRLARLPDAVGLQFKTADVAQEWEDYEQHGVKMANMYAAYLPGITADSIVFCISQMRLVPDTLGSSASGTSLRLKGRGARWISVPEDHLLSDSQLQANVHGAINGLFGCARQRLGDISVLSGGTQDFFSENPDSQTIAVYVHHGVEHPLVRRSNPSLGPRTFDFRSYTFVSDMHDGRVMIANPRNNVFGIIDTATGRIRNVMSVGPLATLVNSETFDATPRSFVGPNFLIDPQRDSFVAISYRTVNDLGKAQRLGIIINTYDSNGELLYSKVFDEVTEKRSNRLWFYHILNNQLLGFNENNSTLELVTLDL